MNSAAAQELTALAKVLKDFGSVQLASTPTKLDMYKHALTFASNGWTKPGWPISTAGAFRLEYDDETGTWACSGSLYDVEPQALTPKVWFAEVAKGIANKDHLINGMLQKAATIWERYNGDLRHFTYRLGVEFSAIGVMTTLTPDHYVWKHAADPLVMLAFSAEPRRIGPPELRFGFFAPTITHKWTLSVQTLMNERKQIQATVVDMTAHLAKMSSCVDSL
jgi:hypothetical protein